MQILAMGGGGFSAEPDNLALDRYALHMTGKDRPNVCFVPTASGESPDLVSRFHTAFETMPCERSVLSLFAPNSADLRGFLLEQDLVYVGGGNTRSMLALWKEWGVDEILREAAFAGTVLAGTSAGMICWFEEGLTDSIPGQLNPIACLGFLQGSACPHFDAEPERRPTFNRLIREGTMVPGFAADDGAALHFREGKIVRCVASRNAAEAFSVDLEGETPLPTDRLPS